MHDEEPDRLIKNKIKMEKGMDTTVIVAVRSRDPREKSLLYNSRGNDADALANQLYTLPAYRESVQGMCSRSDSLGSIVVNPSLMFSVQDPSNRNTEPELEKNVDSETQEKRDHTNIVTEIDSTETEPHLEKVVVSETKEKSDHMDIVTEFDSKDGESNKLCRRVYELRN
jgi:hypothetical protein